MKVCIFVSSSSNLLYASLCCSRTYFAMASSLGPSWLTFGGRPNHSSSLLEATFPSWQGLKSHKLLTWTDIRATCTHINETSRDKSSLHLEEFQHHLLPQGPRGHCVVGQGAVEWSCGTSP